MPTHTAQYRFPSDVCTKSLKSMPCRVRCDRRRRSADDRMHCNGTAGCHQLTTCTHCTRTCMMTGPHNDEHDTLRICTPHSIRLNALGCGQSRGDKTKYRSHGASLIFCSRACLRNQTTHARTHTATRAAYACTGEHEPHTTYSGVAGVVRSPASAIECECMCVCACVSVC